MTPLEYAETLLQRLVAIDSTVPEPRVASVGPAVVSCSETRASVMSVSLQVNPVNPLACDVTQLATYSVSISRECANTSNDDGSENYTALAEVAALADQDTSTLSQFFSELNSDPAAAILDPSALPGVMFTRTGTISSTISGALLFTELQLTVGVP